MQTYVESLIWFGWTRSKLLMFPEQVLVHLWLDHTITSHYYNYYYFMNILRTLQRVWHSWQRCTVDLCHSVSVHRDCCWKLHEIRYQHYHPGQLYNSPWTINKSKCHTLCRLIHCLVYYQWCLHYCKYATILHWWNSRICYPTCYITATAYLYAHNHR